MDAIWIALPFLALLACPLMMLFCVVGMRRRGRGAEASATPAFGTTDERLARLQHQLLAAQAELEELRTGAAQPRRPEVAAPAERAAGAEAALAVRPVA